MSVDKERNERKTVRWLLQIYSRDVNQSEGTQLLFVYKLHFQKVDKQGGMS